MTYNQGVIGRVDSGQIGRHFKGYGGALFWRVGNLKWSERTPLEPQQFQSNLPIQKNPENFYLLSYTIEMGGVILKPGVGVLIAYQGLDALYEFSAEVLTVQLTSTGKKQIKLSLPEKGWRVHCRSQTAP